MNKKAPYILLSVLAIILTFILGVRYGQKVEQTNEAVSYYLTITPPVKTPTEAPLEFKTYKNKGCAVEFLYPSTLSLKKESSTAARFGRKDEIVLDLNCAASPSAVPKNRILEKKFNTITGKNIYFMIEESLQPLIEKSLKFGR